MSNHLIKPEDFDDTLTEVIIASSTREHKQLYVCITYGSVGPNKELTSRTWFKIKHRNQIIWIGPYIRLAMKKYNEIHSSYQSTPIEEPRYSKQHE